MIRNGNNLSQHPIAQNLLVAAAAGTLTMAALIGAKGAVEHYIEEHLEMNYVDTISPQDGESVMSIS